MTGLQEVFQLLPMDFRLLTMNFQFLPEVFRPSSNAFRQFSQVHGGAVDTCRCFCVWRI